MKSTLTAAIGIALATMVVAAQQPAQAPKPGPEQKRIEYFAGNWSFEGEAKQSPLGPAGKISSTESCSAWLNSQRATRSAPTSQCVKPKI